MSNAGSSGSDLQITPLAQDAHGFLNDLGEGARVPAEFLAGAGVVEAEGGAEGAQGLGGDQIGRTQAVDERGDGADDG